MDQKAAFQEFYVLLLLVTYIKLLSSALFQYFHHLSDENAQKEKLYSSFTVTVYKYKIPVFAFNSICKVWLLLVSFVYSR